MEPCCVSIETPRVYSSLNVDGGEGWGVMLLVRCAATEELKADARSWDGKAEDLVRKSGMGREGVLCSDFTCYCVPSAQPASEAASVTPKFNWAVCREETCPGSPSQEVLQPPFKPKSVQFWGPHSILYIGLGVKLWRWDKVSVPSPGLFDPGLPVLYTFWNHPEH